MQRFLLDRRKVRMEVFRKYPPKEKKIIGRKPVYTSEFMYMVGKKVVEEGLTMRAAAKQFNISQGSVNLWSKSFRAGNLSVLDAKHEVTSSAQIHRLEDQVKDLK